MGFHAMECFPTGRVFPRSRDIIINKKHIDKMSDGSGGISPQSIKVVESIFFVCVSIVIGGVLRNTNASLTKSSITSSQTEGEVKQKKNVKSSQFTSPSRPHEHEKKMQERIATEVKSTENQGKGGEYEGSDNSGEEELERNKVVVRVPATSANLGPGFDAIGMAIDMWSEFTVERSDKFEVICEGEGSYDMPLDETNLVCYGVAAAFKKAGKPLPTLKYHLINRIPYARGLGSSSAAIVGGLVAGFVIAGYRVPAWGSEELLNLAAEIEGHPDNVAPALYGGIQLGIHTGSRWMTERVNIPPGLQCICFIPETIGKTSTARAVLSDTISRKEAIFNIGRVAWLINALATNNIDQLKYGVEDRLHQPQRSKIYPHLDPIIDAAVEAGASAAYLSGAGPTIMAITSGASGDIFTQRAKERVDTKVADAMLVAAKTCGTVGKVYITSPVEKGALVVSAEPAFSRGLVKFGDNV